MIVDLEKRLVWIKALGDYDELADEPLYIRHEKTIKRIAKWLSLTALLPARREE